MAITAGMVKELREMTGAGMMDCKTAERKRSGCIRKEGGSYRIRRYGCSIPER